MSEYETKPFGREYTMIASEATSDVRADFLKKTYLHLLGAVLAFMCIEAALMRLESIRDIAGTMVTGWNWLIVMAVFIGGSMAAERMARNAVSLGAQYAGLAIYVLLWSVVFIPLMYIALQFQQKLGQPIVATAAFGSLGIFGAMTAIVLITRKDFSFLRAALMMGAVIAIALIVCGILFNFDLGPIFAIAMIGLASLWILYDTSNVLHHYQTNQYVSAALALFGSLALLFWYVLRLAMYIYSSRD